jgi:hypothetical protein
MPGRASIANGLGLPVLATECLVKEDPEYPQKFSWHALEKGKGAPILRDVGA